ncbi:MAG TPA: EamA family transporter [Ideonella sp.]|uniref:EamA family transporter n=1 Tax=Ideonella sp. TaxID=1929293 RepID=UPI002E339534|nr:EamA family transporter [Ideonella sp.]HEX5682534.1 EamA family transporter [Ideonella sp.]
MPVSHLALALAVVAVWGTNFVVIKWGLAELPPFLLAALRFALSSLPFLLFIRRPATGWARLAAFGVLLGAGQFGLLFLAMKADISPGLASLVVQAQVFFTIALAGQRLKLAQIGALALAVAGMGWIGWQAHQGGAGISLAGLGMVLAAAFCWALANAVARSAGKVDALGFMVWSSLFAVPPLVLLSLVFDGGVDVVGAALVAAGPAAWAVVVWQAVGNTLFGYGAWNWLLARHPPATVTPAALLVPVFGMGASAIAFGEALPAWKLGAAGLVMTGLALNLWAVSR